MTKLLQKEKSYLLEADEETLQVLIDFAREALWKNAEKHNQDFEDYLDFENSLSEHVKTFKTLCSIADRSSMFKETMKEIEGDLFSSEE